MSRKESSNLREGAGARRLKTKVAGGPGFEPRLTESESAVLPLNYPPSKPLWFFAFSESYSIRGQEFSTGVAGGAEIGGFWHLVKP